MYKYITMNSNVYMTRMQHLNDNRRKIKKVERDPEEGREEGGKQHRGLTLRKVHMYLQMYQNKRPYCV